MINAKEVEAMKRRLRQAADEDHSKRARQAQLTVYAKKSTKKMRKAKGPKRGKGGDFFTVGNRLPGPAYGGRR
jgi:hypothetical protein